MNHTLKARSFDRFVFSAEGSVFSVSTVRNRVSVVFVNYGNVRYVVAVAIRSVTSTLNGYSLLLFLGVETGHFDLCSFLLNPVPVVIGKLCLTYLTNPFPSRLGDLIFFFFNIPKSSPAVCRTVLTLLHHFPLVIVGRDSS